MSGRAAWAAAVVVLAGCSTPDVATPDDVETPAVVATLDCGGSIQAFAHPLDPSEWSIAAGSAAFVSGPPVERGRDGPADSAVDGLQFAKFGLAVREGTDVTLTAQDGPHRALLGWGTDEPARQLDYSGCPGEGDRWLVFAGGLWVPDADCYAIEVRAGSEAEMLMVGVDHPC